MSKRDVQLVIRAKNEASRAVDSISKAFSQLSSAVADVDGKSGSAGSAVNKLGQSVKTLESISRRTGRNAADAFAKVEAAVEKSSAALSKQKSDLRESQAQFAATKKQIEAARREIDKLQGAIVEAGVAGDRDGMRDLQARLKLAENAYRSLQAQVEKFPAALRAGEANLRRTSEEFNRLQGTAAVARGALNIYQRESDQAKSATARANSELRKTPGATAAATRGINQLTQSNRGLRDAMRAIYGESRRAMSTMQRLRGQALSLTASYVGLYEIINQVGQVINVVREFDAAEVRLRSVFEGDADRAAVELQFVRDEAVRLGVQFSVLAKQYSDFAIAAKFANFEIEDTRNVFRALTEAGRVFNADNQQMAGIFRALTQIMSKGKVQAEELRGQLGDRLSGAFQIMAAALGVTTGELNEMLEAGEVLADRNTILNFANEFNERFGDQLPEALETTSAKIGRFQALIDELRISFAQGGFIDPFLDALTQLNEFLASREGEEFFETLGAAAGRAVQTVTLLAQNADLLILLLKALVAIKVVQFFNIMRVQLGAMSTSSTVARTSVNNLILSMLRFGQTGTGRFAVGARVAGGALLSFRGAAIRAASAIRALWIAVGGIPGLIVGAITFLIPSLFGDMTDSINTVNSALRRHEEILNRMRSAYVEAAESGNEWVEQIENLNAAEAEANIRDLENAFSEAVRNIESRFGRLRRSVTTDSLFNDNIADVNRMRAIWRMIPTLEQGRITVDQFRDALTRMSNEADSEEFDVFRRAVEEYLDAAQAAERGTEEASAALRIIRDEATDADYALLGLTSALRGANAVLDARSPAAYAEVLTQLEDAIPDLRKLREFREEQEKLAAAFAEAQANAQSFADQADARRAYDDALDALDAARVDGFNYDEVIDRIAPVAADNVARLELERQLRDAAETLQAAGAEYLTSSNLALANLVGADAALQIARNPDTPLTSGQSAATGGATDGNGAIAFAAAAVGKSQVQVELERELARQAERRAQAQANFNERIDEANAKREFELGLNDESRRQAELARAIRQAEVDAASQGVELSATRRAEIERTVGAEFDAAEATRRSQTLEQARLDLAVARGDQESRTAFVQRRAREENIDLLTEEGQQYAQIIGALYDIQQAERDREATQSRLNALQEHRALILEQMQNARENGDAQAFSELETQLLTINDQLRLAVEQMIAFYEAMGGPEAQAAIAQLRSVSESLDANTTSAGQFETQVKRTFANGVVNAVDKFGQAVAEGENFFKAAGRAFRDFAVDFLRQMSLMIMRALILRALGVPMGSGGAGGGGNGGLIAGLFHDGGVVGEGGGLRAASASWFTNAKRYHGGGIPGLKSNEVPAILEKGEEVLTRDDSRHAMNGGGGGKPNVKIVNAIDAGDFLSKALDTDEGQEAILNFIRANPNAVGSALS